jgi:hypothetical protein
LPTIAIKRVDGTIEIVKEFAYEDFKNRLSWKPFHIWYNYQH